VSHGAGSKPSLELEVEALRRRLGPVKVALIEQWIREVNGPFDALIAERVHAAARVLDAGCSRGDPDLPAMFHGGVVIGLDMDILGLRANHLARACVMAPMERMPFSDASFDVVVSKWTAEHLEHPEAVFREMARVLRPGGAICLLTPNALGLFVLVSRLIPFRLKQIIKGRLFQGHEEDTFRTWYRANTVRRLNHLMAQAGLCPLRVESLPGMWTFFIFNRRAALVVRALERGMQRLPVLRHHAAYLMGAWRKE
jgi:SAM-dependent methyltransferase